MSPRHNAANILAERLRGGTVTVKALQQVQRRREFPTRVTRRLQIVMQNKLIQPAMCTENLIRVDDVMESPKLAE
jgi:hypothetical protein